ncbi:pectate lyase superfamily protein-domain-containing protein [Colletotrichum phormii]|uniref:Pectate lyase superfamily protein-domain-containing protein n=1 Tax=Colletotrichum phormii TaxID=359342 RepID=A0AAJ0EJ73_9PEZI|nr:pectate lyase superfamily protein-domain-containing protein [Colletotrichum phormii]KAK1638756.1 pectate lyase superfamily protein-domain-containing protein [Colletotrichum phormii]
MALRHSILALCFVALIALDHNSGQTNAQYLQNFDRIRLTNPVSRTQYDGYRYKGVIDNGLAWRNVIDLSEKETIYLYYNCHYMNNICDNVNIFLNSSRGQNLHPGTTIPANQFTYDFDTGDESWTHQSGRREKSCPSNWGINRGCPEKKGQKPPSAMTANGNIIKRSGMRYTCDEFPPATWVEGGSGWANNQPANTRCAGHACFDPLAPVVNGKRVSVKAEQDWQARTHKTLRDVLLERAAVHNREFDWHDPLNPQRDTAFFRFAAMDLGADGIAAVVFKTNEITGVGEDHRLIPQARRRGLNSTTRDQNENPNEPTRVPRSRYGPSFKGALKRMRAGHYRVVENIPAEFNDSFVTTEPAFGDMADSGMRAAGSANLNTNNKTSRRFETLKRQGKKRCRQLFLSAQSLYSARPHRVISTKPVGSWKLPSRPRPSSTRLDWKARCATNTGSSPVPSSVERLWTRVATPAALLAEAEAEMPQDGIAPPSSNITRRAAAGSYWMESIARKGVVPWGDDPSYTVFRNVLDYGATGNGVTDDTAAIKRAMNDGRRCGEKCNGSTVKNAIVYFPPGTYLISSTVPLPFGTQVIGDAINRPVLVASKSFIGLGVLSTDEYTGGGTGPDGHDQQWYVNTANFYRQIRNVIIDVRPAPPSEEAACLHYQVAQATSMQNVELRAGAGQKGLFAENGSGGGISDVTFVGGDICLYGGEQQFTAQRLVFSGCDVGVQVIWDWGWVWKSITMTGVKTGFKFVPDYPDGSIGSSLIMDSSFTNVGTVVVIQPPSSEAGSGSTGLVLENIAMSGVTTAVADTTGRSLLAASTRLDEWVLGPVYSSSAAAGARSFSPGGKIGNYRRDSALLDAQGACYERPKPQYEGRGVSDFLHVRDFGATGDGATDDTAAFQLAVDSSQGSILFVDAGSYILTGAVTVPAGVKMVGETWSQLVARGPAFSDESKPTPMLRWAAPARSAMSRSGAVLVEWNMAADAKGSAALWDCHVRVGGATGTDLTPAECPALTSGIAPGCTAASLMMHIKPGASGYFENMWPWVADHIIDDPDLEDGNNTMVQNSVYVARGLLVESTEPTWLYGTSSEHAVMYQYNFHNAASVFAAMIQTESPYYQPTPTPPAPFASSVGLFPGASDYSCAASDEFSGCDESWAVVMRGCEDIVIAGAGLVRWEHLVTIGAKYTAVMDGKGIAAKDNLNVDAHPFWSHISLLDVTSDGEQYNDVLWLDPSIWDMEQPEFSCEPPCRVKIPPYTGATTTVNYTLMTVSQDAWTSTITVRPMTLSKLGFEVMTIGGSNVKRNVGGLNRRAFEDFWPAPATTAAWPVVVYNGPDGKESTASPKAPYPTQPPSIEPGSPSPQSGAWPAKALRPRMAAAVDPNKELNDRLKDWMCRQAAESPSYYDMDMLDCPGMGGNNNDSGGQMPMGDGTGWDVPKISNNGTMSLPGFFPWGSVLSEPGRMCELPQESKTTTTRAQTTQPSQPSQPTAKPLNGGRKMSNIRLQNGINSFCKNIGSDVGVQARDLEGRATGQLPGGYKKESIKPFSGQEEISFSFEVLDGCSWTFNMDECTRYFKTPVDSCNCGGENGKQGGYGNNNCLRWKTDPNRSAY